MVIKFAECIKILKKIKIMKKYHKKLDNLFFLNLNVATI